MADVEKMYQAPEKLGEIQAPNEGDSGVSPETRLLVGQAAPWLKFLGVMGFVGCGLTAFGGLSVLLAGSLASMSKVFGGMGALVGAVYLGFAVALFFPARFMFKMGTAGSAFKLQAQGLALQEMILNLKKWAKYYGIMTLVLIGIGILAIIGVIIYAIVNAAMKDL